MKNREKSIFANVLDILYMIHINDINSEVLKTAAYHCNSSWSSREK
jgi:hypothetical protein